MKVLLFQTAAGTLFPVTQLVPQEPNDDQEPIGRIRRIEKKVLKAYWKLARRLPYQELFCTQLRHASEIEVLHATALAEETARDQFRSFLRSQRRKHTLWLYIDGFLALGGAFLTPIPGPNLFFFYPAARCWGHYLARWGARQALALETVSFRVEPLIDGPHSHLLDPGQLRADLEQISARYNLNQLSRVQSALSHTHGR